jgi:hypothetical protein
MGELMKDEIAYLEKEITNYGWRLLKQLLNFLPNFLLDLIELWLRILVRELNNLTFFLERDFIPDYFIQEMHGLADGAGMDFTDVVRYNMIPEMLKAWCCLVSAWGNATLDSNVFVYRALDWDPNAPISKDPVIVIYHPNKGVPFADIGFPGLIGSFTSISSNQIAIGEQMWGLFYGAHVGLIGEPWHFVLRDVAQFATSIWDAMKILTEKKRTCFIHLILGSGKDNLGRGVYYTSNVLKFFDDKNHTSRDKIDNVVYFPYHGNRCVGSILQAFSNKNISPETYYRLVGPLHKTGDSQSVAMDLKNQIIYFAFAEFGTGIPAYDRPHFKLDLKLFY